MANMKEIAVFAGVSPSTVSLVLNGKAELHRISPATVRKVREAARQLGYRPNIQARRLRSDGEHAAPVVALFWTVDSRSSLIGRFLRGVQTALGRLSPEVELLIQPYVGSALSENRSLATGTRYHAAIIANATEEDEEFLAHADLNVPIVLYQRDSEKYCTVDADNREAGRVAARSFADKGCTDVGLVVPDISSGAARLRMEGFREGCRQFGLTLREESIVRAEFSEKGGYEAACRLAALAVRPQAVFFLSDRMAIGGLYAFHERGVRVPDEIRVMGFDDDAQAGYSIPALTTIRLPVEEMAEACVETALQLMTHSVSAPVRRVFRTELVERQSH